MEILNYTSHDVKLNDGTMYPSTGKKITVKVQYSQIEDSFYKSDIVLDGLPEEKEQTFYIVGKKIQLLGTLQGRTDLITPAVHHPATVFDEKKKIISVPGFEI